MPLIVDIENLLKERLNLLKHGGDVVFNSLTILSFSIIDISSGNYDRLISMRKVTDRFMFYANYAIHAEESILVTLRGKPVVLMQPVKKNLKAYKNTLFL